LRKVAAALDHRPEGIIVFLLEPPTITEQA
jgi:hypothetical protein